MIELLYQLRTIPLTICILISGFVLIVFSCIPNSVSVLVPDQKSVAGAGLQELDFRCASGEVTIDEDLDRQILDACRAGDKQTLCDLPAEKLNSGSSEIRNWIVTAGAAEHLTTQWQEYVPCYRSKAGTGCGMAFAVWA